jgi:hypothetical protein
LSAIDHLTFEVFLLFFTGDATSGGGSHFKAFSFDGFGAFFARTKGPFLDPVESFFDLAEKEDLSTF